VSKRALNAWAAHGARHAHCRVEPTDETVVEAIGLDHPLRRAFAV
jgi:hypothetical protein